MKLGELKIASLMLLAPSLEINYDSDDEISISEKIMELKSNPNISDYMAHLPHSINRAFSIIEGNGATRTKLIKAPREMLEKSSRGYILDLDKLCKNILYVERVYQGNLCEFEKEDGNKILLKSKGKKELEIFYKSRLARINESTSDLLEIDLDESVLDILPYFIKGELIQSEDSDEAKIAKNHFFDLLKPFSKTEPRHNNISVETVFSIE